MPTLIVNVNLRLPSSLYMVIICTIFPKLNLQQQPSTISENSSEFTSLKPPLSSLASFQLFGTFPDTAILRDMKATGSNSAFFIPASRDRFVEREEIFRSIPREGSTREITVLSSRKKQQNIDSFGPGY